MVLAPDANVLQKVTGAAGALALQSAETQPDAAGMSVECEFGDVGLH